MPVTAQLMGHRSKQTFWLHRLLTTPWKMTTPSKQGRIADLRLILFLPGMLLLAGEEPPLSIIAHPEPVSSGITTLAAPT